MAVLTIIAGVPLYSTVQEAVAWARANGISGSHTHGWQGQTGYMGGTSHNITTQGPTTTTFTQQTSTMQTTPTPQTTSTTTTTSSGGGGY